MQTVHGYMNVFPRDTAKGPDRTTVFTPHPRSVVYPTGELARLHGDRRAALRPVEFMVKDDEYFQVLLESDPRARAGLMTGIGNFVDYTAAFGAMIELAPKGYRSEIKIMVPTHTDVEVIDRDGEPAVFGASLNWLPSPIAPRLKLVQNDW